MAKKILLFIVEGDTDKIALTRVLKQFFQVNKNLLETYSANGDLLATYAYRATPKQAIGEVINKFLDEYNFTSKKVLYRIIHLIDTDGCYIPDANIIYNPIYTKDKGSFYSNTTIQTDNVKEKVDRNNRKRVFIKAMLNTQYVAKTIPYEMYYFSHNRDYVCFGNHNPTQIDKNNYAVQFKKMYENDFEGFVKFIESTYPPVPKEKIPSWTFIQDGLHSLEKWSNFYLFLLRYCCFIQTQEEYMQKLQELNELIQKENPTPEDIENKFKLELLLNWYSKNNN